MRNGIFLLDNSVAKAETAALFPTDLKNCVIMTYVMIYIQYKAEKLDLEAKRG